MSQEQLAQKIHVTRQAVSNWETGRSQPDLDMLETLASAFGTDILVVIYGQMPAGADEETRSAVRKRHLKRPCSGHPDPGLIPHSDSVRTGIWMC